MEIGANDSRIGALRSDEYELRYLLWSRRAVPEPRDPTLNDDVNPTEVTLLLRLSGADHRLRRKAIERDFRRSALQFQRSAFRAIVKEHVTRIPVGERVLLMRDYARPISCEASLAFLGLPRGLRDVVLEQSYSILSFDPANRARRRLASLRLFRAVRRAVDDNEYAPGSVIDDALQRGVSDADINGLILTSLIAGTELSARAMLGCIVEDVRLTGDHDLDRSSLARALDRSEIVPFVFRTIVNTGDLQQVSSPPLGTTVRIPLKGREYGEYAPLPFGRGDHHCLGSWFVYELLTALLLELRAADISLHVWREIRAPITAVPAGLQDIEVVARVGDSA